MDLADKVIEANKEQEKSYEVDELGLGIANTTDYIAARALYRNYLARMKDPDVGLLHNRNHGKELWRGETQLKKHKNTIYELADWKKNLKDYELEAVWASLLRNTPSLDTSKIIVDAHTYWDTERCELVHTSEELLSI